MAGVNNIGNIWQWKDNLSTWKDINLPSGSPYPKQLSVGSDGIMFALDVKNQTYCRQNESWKKIDGLCTQIDAADKDTVFCVNQDGKVLQY
jgi:hypothetical protein